MAKKKKKGVWIQWPTRVDRFPRIIVHDPANALGYSEWRALLDRFTESREDDNG